ncbi:MAG: DUF1566 domain-containing protein [Burkholderiales bacterium]|nr:DUF1566 domain-containing protein [Burkholderiales bacterium]
MKHKYKHAVLFAAGLLSANLAQAALSSNGNGLVYDSVANVTWSSDANLFGTMLAGNANLVNQIIAASPTVTDTSNALDTPANSGFHSVSAADFGPGYTSWFGAMAFTKYLNSTHYLGQNTWMLPTTYDQTCGGYCTNSMLGELFYTGLGGVAGQSVTTTHNASYSLFTNIQNSVYWSGTEYAANPNNAWFFATNSGGQVAPFKYSYDYSWAVLPGNAGASVPEPAGLALFGIGLLGLMAGRRRPSFW